MRLGIIALLLLLGGCSHMAAGTKISTETCIGSALFGFQECVTVEHPPAK